MKEGCNENEMMVSLGGGAGKEGVTFKRNVPCKIRASTLIPNAGRRI